MSRKMSRTSAISWKDVTKNRVVKHYTSFETYGSFHILPILYEIQLITKYSEIQKYIIFSIKKLVPKLLTNSNWF